MVPDIELRRGGHGRLGGVVLRTIRLEDKEDLSLTESSLVQPGQFGGILCFRRDGLFTRSPRPFISAGPVDSSVCLFVIQDRISRMNWIWHPTTDFW